MNPEIKITTETLDDFPLLPGIMIRLGLPGVIDRHLKRHGLQQRLSWGWMTVIWLAHMLTEGNHRKQAVQAWVRQASETIKRISGQMDGFSKILLTDYANQLDETGKGYLNRIVTASQNMKRLIDDLLDLSRVSSAEQLPFLFLAPFWQRFGKTILYKIRM